ncbi:MAG: flagellar basal body P-ring formation chaperone FlgA [Thermodesulfobacteriota bacterium]|nr:flagellar basal body P-ring formation chaperone FlgA [Thermodesulfobacteriota bacterium]
MQCPNFFSILAFSLSVTVFALGISGYVCAADTTVIKIFEKTDIENDRILLGKIAKITGKDRGLIQRLESIVIGRSPLPGKSRLIDEDYIKIRLRQGDIDLSQITMEVPKKIEVFRTFIEIPKDNIERIVSDFVYDKTRKRKRVTVNNVRVDNEVILPRGEVTYEVIPPRNTDVLGTIPLQVCFRVNGRPEKKIWVTANIEITTEVVVTKRPLGRFSLITGDDIHLQKRDLADLPANVISDCEEVLGKRAKRKIDANAILRTDLVELPPLIKRGDVVLIVAESDGLRITALGKAKGKGHRGERIRVVNFDSNKGIYARVLDSNTVKVDF